MGGRDGFGHVLLAGICFGVLLPFTFRGLGYLILPGRSRGMCGEGFLRYPVINEEAEEFRDLRRFPQNRDRAL